MINQTNADPQPTAAMVAIGDELLSGRTKDANIHHLAKWLNARGVHLTEVRIVSDDTSSIVGAVNALRQTSDYVFTSGGIGPTHDDITADAIGVAFGVKTIENPDALAILKDWYGAKGEDVTDARRRMARTPIGSKLIVNDVSGAPGFSLENVHVMAGVPAVFNSMLETLDDVIQRGPTYIAYTVQGPAQESQLAEGLLALETALKGLRIGSYPGKSGTTGQLSVVCKAFDEDLARRAATAVEGLFRAQGTSAEILEGFGPELE